MSRGAKPEVVLQGGVDVPTGLLPEAHLSLQVFSMTTKVIDAYLTYFIWMDALICQQYFAI